MARLRGKLPGGTVPAEALVHQFRDADEAARFVETVRARPELLAATVDQLVGGAAYVHATEEGEKKRIAFTLLALVADIEPSGKSPWWLKTLVSGALDALDERDVPRAVHFGKLLRPFRDEMSVDPRFPKLRTHPKLRAIFAGA